ncbi:MAG: PKD domain-containing protein [Chitinophagales bacterium]
MVQHREKYPQYAFISLEEDAFANFSFTSSGLFVSFINYSIANGSIHWNFGDGDTSNLTKPVHIYATPGEYRVVLTITTSEFCMATDTQTVFLSPSADITSAINGGDMVVFPNPFTGAFYITSNNFIPIAMWDLMGNKMEIKKQLMMGI